MAGQGPSRSGLARNRQAPEHLWEATPPPLFLINHDVLIENLEALGKDAGLIGLRVDARGV